MNNGNNRSGINAAGDHSGFSDGNCNRNVGISGNCNRNFIGIAMKTRAATEMVRGGQPQSTKKSSYGINDGNG